MYAVAFRRRYLRMGFNILMERYLGFYQEL
jgi:hypothetical protein